MGLSEARWQWPFVRAALHTPVLCVLLASCIMMTGCSTAVNLKTPLEQPRYAPVTSGAPLPIIVLRGPTYNEVAEAIEEYLRHSPRWKLLEGKEAGQTYSLAWRVLAEKFHSDLATKRSAVVYFYCWGITAPAGLFYANVMRWHATDFLEIQMTLKGSDGRVIYEQKENLTTSEFDTTLPATEDLKREMRKRTVANLVTLMLNRIEKVVEQQVP